VKKPLIKLKNGSEKCPHCGTIFEPKDLYQSLHPFDVAVREEFKQRRSKAAKLGWKRRRARLKATLSPKVTKWM